MDEITKLEFYFDDLLDQTQTWKLTHEQLENGRRYETFVQLKDWKLKHGYKLNIYSNDHLIDGKKHFHFDNREANVSCKIDFDGNILADHGIKSLPSNIHKELRYFLSNASIQEQIEKIWNEKNTPQIN